jgi:hypothetical protein
VSRRARRLLLPALLLFAPGCANLPTTGDGVVALEVTQPSTLTLAQGNAVQLEARALDRSGAEVAAEIRWLTPDTTVTVDSLTGLVTAVAESGSGKVQASHGTLRSSLITFTLAPAPGTVRD